MNPSDQHPDPLVDLFFKFIRIAMHSVIPHIRECGISMPQLNTLMLLSKLGTLAISDIGNHMGISTAASSQLIDRMASDGLILRTEDPDDRRVKQIRLTDKGAKVLKDSFQASQKSADELFQPLTEAEKEQVTQTFKLLVERLQPGQHPANPQAKHSES
jgi:DNA-binding MarR family transcriptional regulator